MAVSANTLFHFTRTPEKLLSILRGAFLPSYHFEDLSSVLPEGPIFDVYVPMVCFCDIPLSQIKDHLANYGDYGIGLKKSWGMRKGISPIVYVAPHSRTAHLVRAVVKEAGKDGFKGSPIREDLLDFCKYIKAYQGKELPPDVQPMKRVSKKVDRIYYDEREWRYSPKNFRVYSATIGNKQEVSQQNELLQAMDQLPFRANDVKYIIVAKENEISVTVREIESLKRNGGSKRFSANAARLLASRVISAEQIRADM